MPDKIHRQLFNIDTDTGTQSIIGPGFFGGVIQIGWNVETADTGADLSISLQPGDAADTGEGWTIYDNNDCLGADFLHPLVRNNVHANGLDTGAGGSQSVVASGADRLHVKVTPGGVAVKGKLYAWQYGG